MGRGPLVRSCYSSDRNATVMKAVRKKVLWALLKAGVLAAVVYYVAGYLQVEDELVVRPSGGAQASALARLSLPTTDGRTLELRAGTRLRIVSESPVPEGAPAVAPEVPFVLARATDGVSFVVPLGDIGGSSPVFERLPGLRSTWRELSPLWFLAAIGLYGPAVFLMVPRWRILLAASGVRIPFWTAVRLVYMSHFLNTFMPGGGVGGDAVRAVVVAHHSDRKAEAATMVLIDRVVGLLGLLAMAGAAVVLGAKQVKGAALPVGILSLSFLVGVGLCYSEKVRRFLRYDAILMRLPKRDWWLRADAALLNLKRTKGALLSAFGLTLCLQIMEVFGVVCAGHALGMQKATIAHYFAFVPIGYLANAIPLSFGGIGVMEGAYLKLFSDAGVATASQALMLGMLARVAASAWALPGALSALFPPRVQGCAERGGAATS
jgi:glycosyltransferase 2 family protein